MKREVEIRSHKRGLPQPSLAFYQMTARLQAGFLEKVLAKQLERELADLSRDTLDRMKETY